MHCYTFATGGFVSQHDCYMHIMSVVDSEVRTHSRVVQKTYILLYIALFTYNIIMVSKGAHPIRRTTTFVVVIFGSRIPKNATLSFVHHKSL